MYTIVKCYAKRNGWAKVDLSQKRLDEIIKEYEQAYVTVSHPSEGQFQINLMAIYPTLHASERSHRLYSWLGLQEAGSLTPADPIPNLSEVHKLKVKDVWDYPMTVSIGNENFGEGVDVPFDSLTDLKFTSDNDTGYFSRFTKSSLFSINGNLLRPHKLNDVVYLKNAHRFIDTEDGLLTLQEWDFSELGTLTHVEITEANTVGVPTSETMRKNGKQRFRVNTSVSLAGKFPIAVIDGQPELLTSVVDVYDDHTAVITLDIDRVLVRLVNTPIEYRVGLKETDAYAEAVTANNIDALAFLTNGYSFIVFIDSADINLFTRPLGRTDIPGLFTYPYPPQGAAIDDRGHVVDYGIVGWDGNVASIHTNLAFNPDYLHDYEAAVNIPTGAPVQFSRKFVMSAQMVNIYSLL